MANLEISTFDGGMTDNYINAPLNKYQSADNMVIRPDRTLESRPGCALLSATSFELPGGERVDSAMKFKGTRFYQEENKLYFDGGASFTEVVGPASTSVFTTAVQSFNQNSSAEWNNHVFITNDVRRVPVFMYKDGSNFRLRTLGLPKLTSAEVTAIGMSAGGVNSRNYIFVRSHTYTINGVEFTQRSATSTIKNYTGSITNSITGLPVLANASGEHYETTTIKIEIFRTVNNGATYYKSGEVTNGTTVYSDTVSDANIALNEVLYTDGEELDYDQPPECRYLIQSGGVVYYLNVKDAFGDVYPNMVVQGNPDQPYAAPSGNTVLVDGDITGGGQAGQFPVVFTEKRTYRLQGIYDSTGSGGISAIEINRTVGCISHKSIIETQDGLFFAARDGFYFTDGYKVVRISEDLPDTYLRLVSDSARAKRISGTHDPFNKRVMWAATEGDDATDNDVIFVGHTYFGISPNTPFLRWTGGAWPTSFNPTAILYDEDTNELIRGESKGYLLKHGEASVNDLKVVDAVTPTSWIRVPVIYEYKSFATNFDLVTNRKWVTRLIVSAEAKGKVTISPSSQNDNTQVWNEMAEIRAGTPLIWGDTDVLWSDSSIRWDFVPIVSANRRFPKRSIRCSFKQIRLRNALTTIEDTQTMGQATFDGTTNQVTLINPGVEWANNALDYFVTSSSDGYASQYRITARTATVVTVEDLENTLPTGVFDFRIIGYRLDESLRLLSFSMIYMPISSSQTPFRAS